MQTTRSLNERLLLCAVQRRRTLVGLKLLASIPWKTVLRGSFAIFGLLFVVLVINHAGNELWGLLAAAAIFLPALAAMEGMRIGLEALATWLLLGKPKEPRVASTLIRAQLISYAVCNIMPAGRAAGEGVKATMLTRVAPPARCAAVATAIQAVSLLAVAVVCVPTVVIAWTFTGSWPITLAIAFTGTVSAMGGVAIQLAGRQLWLGKIICRWFPHFSTQAEQFRMRVRAQGLLPWSALIPALISRAIQVAQFWLLAIPLKTPGTLAAAFLANGINLAGSAVGDFVPAHVGFSEAAFALAAEGLGMAAANAVALALLVHAVQLSWAAVGFLLPVLWRLGPAKLAHPSSEQAIAPPLAHEPSATWPSPKRL